MVSILSIAHMEKAVNMNYESVLLIPLNTLMITIRSLITIRGLMGKPRTLRMLARRLVAMKIPMMTTLKM